jgi:Zn-dependent oligopeptidase
MLFDYTTVTPDSIRTRVAEAIAEAEKMVDQVVATGGRGTFDEVLSPLDATADLMGQTFGTTAFMGYVHPDPDTRAAGKQVEEQISKWGVELVFRDDLYEAVKNYSESADAAALEGNRRRFLEFTIRDFRKAGHELTAEARARVKELTNRLVELGVAFERNIAEDTSNLVVGEEDLDGLPPGFVDSLERSEDGQGLIVTTAYPHVIPILDHADSRQLRADVHRMFSSRAVDENRPILEEAIELRSEIAGLFDQPSWAHHQLDQKMAKKPENVDEFIASLRGPLTEAARRDIARMTAMLEEDGEEAPFQVYDWRYYDNRLRKTDYGVDQAAVSEYFPLSQVTDGLLAITGDVFGLEYEKVDAPTWHSDVTTYLIRDTDTGSQVAHFHMDLFPREGKFSHAAAFPLVPGRALPDGTYQMPVSAIVANFTKPSGGRPSLLTHQEVETFFHEFGHILHQTLTTVDLVRFSGTSTERDFVEAPSQIMEHWVWKPDVLSRFARHHQTGEPIPEDMVEQLAAAKQLNVSVATLRQIQFALLDMRLHDASQPKDLDQILQEATDAALLPLVEGTFFPASFGHLMGGYDAGYYGYLWSEVFGDDMFSRFEDEGYTNPSVGREYRHHILEQGGTVDGMRLLENFLGREPNDRAFLRNLGIDA